MLTMRRNRGLFDPTQLDVLQRLADSQTELGQFQEAEQSLRYRVRMAEQSYGTDDPRVAGPISELAEWYSRAAAYEVARSYYRTAIERVEKGGGTDDYCALMGAYFYYLGDRARAQALIRNASDARADQLRNELR